VWVVKMSQYYGVSQQGCSKWLDEGKCGSIFYYAIVLGYDFPSPIVLL